MDYSKIKVPYAGKEEIKKEADLFRQKFWDSTLPVNIERIVDVVLGIQIMPVGELEKFFGVNAFILSDWSAVYVDRDLYMDEKRQNRLRFSLAHELGHFILHKKIYEDLKIKTKEEFYQFIEQIPREQYSYLETQAQKFASFLLVPRERLMAEKNKVLERYKKENKINIENIDVGFLNSYLAIPVSKIFGVSAESMEIILNEENKTNSG